MGKWFCIVNTNFLCLSPWWPEVPDKAVSYRMCSSDAGLLWQLVTFVTELNYAFCLISVFPEVMGFTSRKDNCHNSSYETQSCVAGVANDDLLSHVNNWLVVQCLHLWGSLLLHYHLFFFCHSSLCSSVVYATIDGRHLFKGLSYANKTIIFGGHVLYSKHVRQLIMRIFLLQKISNKELLKLTAQIIRMTCSPQEDGSATFYERWWQYSQNSLEVITRMKTKMRMTKNNLENWGGGITGNAPQLGQGHQTGCRLTEVKKSCFWQFCLMRQ